MDGGCINLVSEPRSLADIDSGVRSRVFKGHLLRRFKRRAESAGFRLPFYRISDVPPLLQLPAAPPPLQTLAPSPPSLPFYFSSSHPSFPSSSSLPTSPADLPLPPFPPPYFTQPSTPTPSHFQRPPATTVASPSSDFKPTRAIQFKLLLNPCLLKPFDDEDDEEEKPKKTFGGNSRRSIFETDVDESFSIRAEKSKIRAENDEIGAEKSEIKSDLQISSSASSSSPPATPPPPPLPLPDPPPPPLPDPATTTTAPPSFLQPPATTVPTAPPSSFQPPAMAEEDESVLSAEREGEERGRKKEIRVEKRLSQFAELTQRVGLGRPGLPNPILALDRLSSGLVTDPPTRLILFTGPGPPEPGPTWLSLSSSFFFPCSIDFKLQQKRELQELLNNGNEVVIGEEQLVNDDSVEEGKAHFAKARLVFEVH